MTIRLNEYGKRIYVITSYDMSSNTSLTIKAVPPSGEANQKTWTATIGGALSNIVDEDGTTITTVNANESMFYDLADGDLDEVGTWTLVGIYDDTASGDHFISDPVTITVGSDNYAA